MTLQFPVAGNPSQFRAGAGRTVMTPPAGYPICGPEHPERLSTGVTDDLLAKVLVIESEGARAAIVALDAWGLSADLGDEIASSVANATDTPVENTWITVSGNGTSPCLWCDHADYIRYSAFLPDIVAGAALMAVRSLEPASMATGAARLPDVSTSVEGPGRPGDEALFAVGFDDALGNGIGRVINFSCPAAIRGPSTEWTADYPGYAMWAVEQGGGGLSLFAQGVSADMRPFDWYAGNSNPSHPERSVADVQAFGLLLATQAAQCLANSTPRRNAPVGSAIDAGAGLNVLRIGPAVFIGARSPQPMRFARHIRRDLPGSTVIVSANLSGERFGDLPELAHGLQQRAVELARGIGAT